MEDKVSVLILTRNRPQILAKCLNSLKIQRVSINQVVVVDNGLEKPAIKIVSGFREDFEIDYFQEKKQGEAFARNKALKLAKGKVLVFIDDDCVADKKWLENIILHFQKYPNCNGLLGKTENYLKENVFANVYQCYYLRWLMENFKEINKTQSLAATSTFFDTKNLALKKNLVKGFSFEPDVLFYNVLVDVVGGQILLRKGGFFYNPEMVVYHHNPDSFKKLILKNFIQGLADQSVFEKKQINNRKRIFDYSFSDWLKICCQEIKGLNFLKKILFWFMLFLYPILYRIGRLFYKIKGSV